jgi:hypothetical protein
MQTATGMIGKYQGLIFVRESDDQTTYSMTQVRLLVIGTHRERSRKSHFDELLTLPNGSKCQFGAFPQSIDCFVC